MEARPNATVTTATDAELVSRIAHGDARAFEQLMRQHNRRLFRVARAILANDAEAEEALQDAYVRIYMQLTTFRGESKLLTWMTRIVVNEALARMRKQKRREVVVPFSRDERESETSAADVAQDTGSSPEEATLRAEIRALIEKKLDELPLAFRTVFIMREVEELTVEETAQCLGIPESTVRTRLFRARALLRESLAREIDIATPDVFAFAGERCDRIVAAVLDRVGDASLQRADSPPPRP